MQKPDGDVVFNNVQDPHHARNLEVVDQLGLRDTRAHQLSDRNASRKAQPQWLARR